MTGSDWHDDLAQLLKERGHTDAEVQKILARVEKYDAEVQHDSVMDSIADGRFDLAAIIEEALNEPDD